MPSKKSKSGKKADYKFDKDEKVLVLPKQAGEDIYEAKVLDRKLDKQKEPQYKIHYKGWNKRWDEWVNQRRLLKINASNVQIMSEKNNQNKLAQQQKDRQSARNNNGHNSSSNDTESINSKSPLPNSGSSSTTNRKRKVRTNSGSSSSKRRKLNNNSSSHNNSNKMDNDSSSSSSDDNNNDNDDDYDISQENTSKRKKKRRSPKAATSKTNGDNTSTTHSSSTQPLEISLPTPLKRKLITDWENITKKHLLIELPRKKEERISSILIDFEQFSIEQGQDKNIVYEISRGIKDYFNQALQVTLLYKLERQQHGILINQNKHLTMDQIYGVEHLCRLFVKLPQLLSPTDLDNDTRKILKDQIECIIAFVLDHEKKYFCTNYIQS